MYRKTGDGLRRLAGVGSFSRWTTALVHAVGSVVGHYLIIDGDTFDADVENQANGKTMC
ncbi:MAG: hypothetical protein ACLTG0_12385 [Oscillibacter sp.]